MKCFSIKELESFSGIKAHTIRIWEHRYRLFNPGRSGGNVRFYSLQDVKLLLDIALLLKNKFRIAALAKMDANEIEQKLKALTSDDDNQEKAINHLVFYMFSSGTEEFETVLNSCLNSWDVDASLKKIIIPFLEKVQLLSYYDNSNEVHFAVTAIRKKIIWGIEKVNPPAVVQKTALLFLPEKEHYDLVLLYLSYILKGCGLKVLYLGTNISCKNLKLIAIEKRPDFLYTYISHKQKFITQDFVPYLQEHLPHTKLFVTRCKGASITSEIGGNVRFIHYNEVLQTLQEN